MDIAGIEYAGYLILPIIVGLCQAIKAFDIDVKMIPIIAIILGLIFSAIMGGELGEIIFRGLTLGLGAVGLHSGVKNVKESVDRSNL